MHVFKRFLKVDKGHFFYLGPLTNFENIHVFGRILKVDNRHVFVLLKNGDFYALREYTCLQIVES